MKLTVLGSGTAVIRPERKGPSLLLEIDDKLILLDCGWGCGQQLSVLEYRLEEIDHIFITHPHPDHMGELMPILQSMYVSGMYYPHTKREKHLFLHGYQGFVRDYDTMKEMSFPNRDEPYSIAIEEYQNTTREVDGLRINSSVVPHFPKLFTSVAYRIESKGEIFFYSGDTSYSENLVSLAKDADIAVFEAAVDPHMFHEQGPRPHHLSPLEAGKLAALAKVKKLVLMHLYDKASEEDILVDVRRNFGEEVWVAQDLMTIENS